VLTKKEGTIMRVAVGGYLVAVNTFATQPFTLEFFQRATIPGGSLLKVSRGGESCIQDSWISLKNEAGKLFLFLSFSRASEGQ
jgi:hypothetical protein